MPFNIQDFIATLKNHDGLSRNNKFEFLITPLYSLPRGNIEDLRFFAEQCNLPGTMYHLHETKRYGYGVSEKRPMDQIFPEVNASFVLTQDSFGYKFFYKWFSFVSPYNVITGLLPGTYLYEYKETYTTNIEIVMYDDIGKARLNIQLRDAFPVVLNDIPLAYADKNNTSKLNLQFAYTDWTTTFID